VPLVFACTGDLLYSSVDGKPKRTRELKRLRNIEARPEVAVLIDEYDEDWERVWWCRLDGRAHVAREGEELQAGLAALTEKYGQYREAPPSGPVIVVEVDRLSGWSAS
jgi:PPOX class probable F420-dependent enzyme